MLGSPLLGALPSGRADAVVGNGKYQQLGLGRNCYLGGGRLRVPQHIGERFAQDGHHLASDGGRDHGVNGTLEAHLRHESQLRANLGGK